METQINPSEFDLQGARQEASDDQILDYLKGKIDYDIDGALQEVGGNATQVLDYLHTSNRLKANPQTTPSTLPTQDELVYLGGKDNPAYQPPATPQTPTEAEVLKQEFKDQEEGLEPSIVDPIEWILGGKLFEGISKVGGNVIDRLSMPRYMKKMFNSWDDKTYEEQQNLYKFMKDQGIVPSDAMVAGSKGSDLGLFLTRNNLFATQEAIQSQNIMATKYLTMTNNILKELRGKNINIDNITDWRSIKQAEDIVTQNIQKLRTSFKQIEKEYYGKVDKVAKNIPDEYKISDVKENMMKQLTEEGVPPEAVSAVDNIMNRFSKPFKGEKAQLEKLNKERARVLVQFKKLKAKQKEAFTKDNDKLAEDIEFKLNNLKNSLQEIDQTKNSLKDIRYMTTSNLLDTIKLINRKIYKPGGSISTKDLDELRGLQIAKNTIEDYLFTSTKSPDLKTALTEARNITKTRVKLFGAKDTGGEKLMLAKMLDSGEYGKVTEYLTGKNAKENILYIRDIYGKDSEAYQTSLHTYLTSKMGISPDKIETILSHKKATDIVGKVDLQKAAAKISTLDSQDLAMIENALGKQSKLDMIAIKKIVTNFADLEDAISKYGRGIASGKRQYIFGADGVATMFGRTLKVIKDATTFHIAKTAEKIINNQPKFRTISGALTGETVYMYNTDQKDLSLEGAIVSAVLGGVGGYYAGKITRSVLESDAKKVARYLESGKGRTLTKEVRESMGRIETALARAEKENQQFAGEYVLPDKKDIGNAFIKYEDNMNDTMGKMAGGGTPPKQPLDLLGKDKVNVDIKPNQLSPEVQTSLDRALNEGAKTGNYRRVQALPIETKQEIVNSLFSRNMGTAKGLTSNQAGKQAHNADYFGTTTKMKPLEFLKGASKRGSSLSDKETRKDFAFNLAKELANNKPVEIGPPKLWLDIQDNKVVVVGHEGRHRADAMYELFGKDINIPVDLQFTEKGTEFRGRYLTDDILNLPVVSQDGKRLGENLTTMYGIGAGTVIASGQDSKADEPQQTTNSNSPEAPEAKDINSEVANYLSDTEDFDTMFKGANALHDRLNSIKDDKLRFTAMAYGKQLMTVKGARKEGETLEETIERIHPGEPAPPAFIDLYKAVFGED